MSKDDTWFLKGIAILLLLYHHIPIDTDLGYIFRSGARVCVWIFVFITAYGFTLQLQDGYDNKPVRFIIKRLLLLYSQMWFFYLFNLIVNFAWNDSLIDYFKSSVFNLPLDMLGLYSIFGKPEIASYWYVNFLIVVIVLFPLLYYLAKWTAWFSIPIVALTTQLIPYKMEFIHGGQLNYYLLIVMLGILFAQKKIFERLARFKKKKEFLVFAFSSILFSVLLVFRYILLPYTEEKWYLNMGPLSTAMAMMIVLFVYLYRTDGKVSKLIQKLGTHSGNIFFIHWFFYHSLYRFFKISNSLVAFAGCLAYCLLVSILVEFIKKKFDYSQRIRKGIKLLLKEDTNQ